MTSVADLLNEYGMAIRGDWGSIDGRAEQDTMDAFADAVREFRDAELPENVVVGLRERADLCLEGGGHWQMYCHEDESA